MLAGWFSGWDCLAEAEVAPSTIYVRSHPPCSSGAGSSLRVVYARSQVRVVDRGWCCFQSEAMAPSFGRVCDALCAVFHVFVSGAASLSPLLVAR
jgi:hypothetical protein